MTDRKIVDPAARGRRLRTLRIVMGYEEQFRWAHALGISPERWNQVEKGRGLSAAMTDLLVERVPGVSADWLRYGLTGGLSVEMARLLGELPPLPLPPLPAPCKDDIKVES